MNQPQVGADPHTSAIAHHWPLVTLVCMICAWMDIHHSPTMASTTPAAREIVSFDHVERCIASPSSAFEEPVDLGHRILMG